MKRRITLACWDYDRTAALADGRVQPEGIDLNYISLPVEETFFRMTRNEEFEMSELSLSSYVLSRNTSDRFIALPVFPSRAFRHTGIYINTNSGIKKPTDLIGKVVGEDYWPYGVEANRTVLEGFLKYSYDQGLANRAYEIEELFAPETHELVLI